MGLTNFPGGLTSFGVPVMPGGLVPPGGNVYFLDPANGNDGYDGRSPDQAFATLAVAYAALTANQNDVLFYIAGSSSITLSAALTWAKNYTHFIGLCAPTGVAQRARIFQLATLTGASPLITISATGCIFANLYIFQGVNDATSLINVSVTGGRNYFHNVHFAGGGHAAQAIDGGASLKLDAAEENLFERCTLGVDTIDAATGMMALLLDTEAHRNEFKECRFRMRAGNTGAGFVEVVDATGIDRDTLFDNCIFINNATANDMASAFVIPAMGEPRLILLKDCLFHNVTKLDASDRGVLFGNMNAVTGADLSGVAVQLIT
jgi:hypothetical protein